ncbi:MAG: HD domain-containing protein [Desulfitobacterium hafniense]|nr:HD domain-containing protein [Desulfitobacterium hafniense]
MLSTAFYIRRMWSFSRALDLALIDEEIERGFKVSLGQRHGERVAYIALSIGKELGFSREDLINLIIAGLLHDIGAIGGFRQFHGDQRLAEEHSRIGASIVRRLKQGESLALAIKYHHETPDPNHGALGIFDVPMSAKILSLADKLDVNIARTLATRAEREKIISWVKEHTGSLVFQEVSEAFIRVSAREAFWMDLNQPELLHISLERLFGSSFRIVQPVEGDKDSTYELALIFADLIDQKSSFTATHSRSVAQVAGSLAEALDWDSDQIQEIKVAGLLHDLGKLAVPKKILDKPGSLDQDELAQIRTHTYYTYRLLTDAGFPGHIVRWAAYHHERLDGKGYPFGVVGEELCTGSRLMTIADIYAALTEDRPYRKEMTPAEALGIIAKGIGTSVDQKLFEVAKRVLA